MSSKKVTNKKLSTTAEYFLEQEKYTKEFGKDAVLFMQIGDFFEAYATLTKGFDLDRIHDITDLTKTRKYKDREVSDRNPYFVGFNQVTLHKYLKKMINGGLTVAVIHQSTKGPKPKRELKGIYSAGAYVEDDSHTNNNIVSITVKNEKQMKSKRSLMCVGLASVDVTTGNCNVGEFYSKSNDENYSLDELYRHLVILQPKKILFDIKMKENLQEIIEYLELEELIIEYVDVDEIYKKSSYQNEFFGRIYPCNNFISNIENIDMENMGYSRLSLVILLNYAKKRNKLFVNNISKPIILKSHNNLILGNNAIYQLNILENTYLDSKTKIKSVYDVVNNTSTSMGKRYMKHSLCQPLTDAEEINIRYECIEELHTFLEDKVHLYLGVEEMLEIIGDIEKLYRKIVYKSIHPYEFHNLLLSVKRVKSLILICQKYDNLSYYVPKKKIMRLLDKFIDEYEKIFNLALLQQRLNDITDSFFNKGIYDEIDSMSANLVNNLELLQNIANSLSLHIVEKKKNLTSKAYFIDEIIDNSLIKIKKTEKEGYFLILTKKRADILREKLENKKTIKVVSSDGNDYVLKIKELEFKDAIPNKNGHYSHTKIFLPLNNKKDTVADNDIPTLKLELFSLIKEKYIEILEDCAEKYKNLFPELCQFISIVDFLKSNAKTAKLYNYCKPKIIERMETIDDTEMGFPLDNGFINVVNLRHPIIERIRTDVEYVPHSIQLGQIPGKENNIDVTLLYGLNSSGKTCLMKAIGILIIMAQLGMYVPAEKFEYSPYESIFARITGNDNLFKGLSQFTLEMNELNAILKRKNKKTLVIGDEVCRGTEHISGNAIVASTIISLAKSGCSSIFATHLHDIVKLNQIKSLKNVKAVHLSVDYDKHNDMLIFDRKLKEGSGSSVYGLTVAKHIIKDEEFLATAQEIMNELLDEEETILSTKTGKYNSNIYVHECMICKKKNTMKKHEGVLDKHHINHQKNCNENGFVIGKSHIKMNNESNLVVLCKICHYKVHHNELEIRGYLETSKGMILDFSYI